MVWQHTPFSIHLLAAGLGTLGVVYWQWRKHPSNRNKYGLLIMLLAAGLLLATTFKLSFVALPAQVSWHLVQSMLFKLLPTAWLLFTLHTLGYQRWLSRPYLVAMSIGPAVITLLILTNPLHGLFWMHYTQLTVDSVVVLQQERAILSYLTSPYHYVVLAAALILAVRIYRQPDDPRRFKAGTLLLIATPPVLFIILYELAKGAAWLNQVFVLGALLSTPLIIWGTRHFGTEHIIPVARTQVIDCLSDVVVVLDQACQVIDLNPAARDLLCPTAAGPDRYLGRPLRELWPADTPLLLADILATTDVIKQETVLVRAGEQRTYDMMVSPIRDGHGTVSSRVIVLHDISERSIQQAALETLNTHLETFVVERTLELENERAQLQAIIDSMGEGLIYTEGESCRVNPALAAMTGYPVETLNGSLANLTRLIADGDTQWAPLQAAPRPAGARQSNLPEAAVVWQGEVRLRRQDGSLFEAELTVAPVVSPVTNLLTSANGQRAASEATVTLVRDVSQQKLLRAQKDLFVTNASHQLRTPMTNIMTRLYLARRQPGRIDEHLQVMENTAEEMSQMIAQMLDISYFEQQAISLQREDVVLQDLLTGIIDSLLARAALKSITLTYEMIAGAVRAWVDAWRLRDALTYLLVFAIDYSQTGGAVHCRLTTAGNQVHLVIQDNSPGPPLEMLPHLFEPFFNTAEGDRKTTGMELTIAKAIIEAHGGTLTAASEPAGGTTFNLYLPLPYPEALRTDGQPG